MHLLCDEFEPNEETPRNNFRAMFVELQASM